MTVMFMHGLTNKGMFYSVLVLPGFVLLESKCSRRNGSDLKKKIKKSMSQLQLSMVKRRCWHVLLNMETNSLRREGEMFSGLLVMEEISMTA